MDKRHIKTRDKRRRQQDQRQETGSRDCKSDCYTRQAGKEPGPGPCRGAPVPPPTGDKPTVGAAFTRARHRIPPIKPNNGRHSRGDGVDGVCSRQTSTETTTLGSVRLASLAENAPSRLLNLVANRLTYSPPTAASSPARQRPTRARGNGEAGAELLVAVTRHQRLWKCHSAIMWLMWLGLIPITALFRIMSSEGGGLQGAALLGEASYWGLIYGGPFLIHTEKKERMNLEAEPDRLQMPQSLL